MRTLEQTAKYSKLDNNDIKDIKKKAEKPAVIEGAANNKESNVMPTTIEDWINLKFSKEFLEKVKSFEDYNFMSKFMFEKAELTYTYTNYIINAFENCGLHIHTVPLYIFQRFISKEIISSHYLSIAVEARFAKNLFNLG